MPNGLNFGQTPDFKFSQSSWKKIWIHYTAMSISFSAKIHFFFSFLNWILCFCLENGLRGKLGKAAYLEKWITKITPLRAKETVFTIAFDWDETMGFPGALVIKNHHHSQFFLRTVSLEDVPGHGRVHFVCNSWVYPAYRYNYNRVFFSNKVISLFIFLDQP